MKSRSKKRQPTFGLTLSPIIELQEGLAEFAMDFFQGDFGTIPSRLKKPAAAA